MQKHHPSVVSVAPRNPHPSHQAATSCSFVFSLTTLCRKKVLRLPILQVKMWIVFNYRTFSSIVDERDFFFRFIFSLQSVEVVWRPKSKPRTCSPTPSLATTTTLVPPTVSGWFQLRKATASSLSSKPLRLRRKQTVATTTWSSLMEPTPNLHGWDATAAQG